MTVEVYLDTETHNGTVLVIDWSPQNLNFGIIVEVRDHIDREENKRQVIEMSFKKLWDLFLKTSLKTYKKPCLREATWLKVSLHCQLSLHFG